MGTGIWLNAQHSHVDTVDSIVQHVRTNCASCVSVHRAILDIASSYMPMFYQYPYDLLWTWDHTG